MAVGLTSKFPELNLAASDVECTNSIIADRIFLVVVLDHRVC